MYNEIIVPLDGSSESARALRPAATISRALGVPLRAVAFHTPNDDGFALRRRLRQRMNELGPTQRTVETAVATRSVAEHLAEVLQAAPAALLVMSTHGQGRSAAVTGSVATHVLATSHRPTLLVGPACDPARFRTHGPLVAAVDTTDRKNAVVRAAAGFVNAFDYEPWVVHVLHRAPVVCGPGGFESTPVIESIDVRRVAQDLGALVTTVAQFEVLHDDRPARAVCDFAVAMRAAVVVMATRAPMGFDRLALGSVAASTVRQSSCPVLVVAP